MVHRSPLPRLTGTLQGRFRCRTQPETIVNSFVSAFCRSGNASQVRFGRLGSRKKDSAPTISNWLAVPWLSRTVVLQNRLGVHSSIACAPTWSSPSRPDALTEHPGVIRCRNNNLTTSNSPSCCRFAVAAVEKRPSSGGDRRLVPGETRQRLRWLAWMQLETHTCSSPAPLPGLGIP